MELVDYDAPSAVIKSNVQTNAAVEAAPSEEMEIAFE